MKYTADKLHGFRAEIYVDGKLEVPQVPQAPEHHQAQNDEDYNESSESDY